MATEQRRCTVHKDLSNELRDYIRIGVCLDLPVEYPLEQYYYCVLHYPHSPKTKNTDFVSVVRQRIDNGQNDFRYIYVPDSATFFGRTFLSQANLNYVTFKQPADFRGIKFNHKISFVGANFNEGAIFSNTEFVQDADFSGASFTLNAVFDTATFRRQADFTNTTFAQDAFFRHSTFENGSIFRTAIFTGDTNFDLVEFKETSFYGATFKGITFFRDAVFNRRVIFSDAFFEENSQIFFIATKFKDEVYFDRTIFSGYVAFEGKFGESVFIGKGAWLSLQDARLGNPERISFKNVRLRPSWFVNVDSRKFIFHDVDWENANGTRRRTNPELKAIKKREITGRPHRLLTIACRQLAANSEENSHYEQASRFRRMAMELIFLEKFLSLRAYLLRAIIFTVKALILIGKYPRTGRIRLKGFIKKTKTKNKNEIPVTLFQSFDPTYLLYRTLSFYGESWGRATIVLFIILVGFAIVYTQTVFQICPIDKPLTLSIQDKLCEIRPLNFAEAISHSLATASFQNVEYQKPITLAGDTLRILEKIFAPLQTALLALALRRKFMR